MWDSAIEATYLANDNTFSMPANPAGNEFEQAWQDGVNRVLNGQQPPAEAMAQTGGGPEGPGRRLGEVG